MLQRASSLDGRTFVLQAAVEGLDLQVGGYAVVEATAGPLLGQIVSLDLASVDGPERRPRPTAASRSTVRLRAVQGRGVVLGGGGRAVPRRARCGRRARPRSARGSTRHRPDRASLEVGTLSLAEGVPFALDAGGFDRHTFLCGQSGSGKTYALGTVLERLLLETSLRLVVLDPNSDYARLAETRPDTDAGGRGALRRGRGGDRRPPRARRRAPTGCACARPSSSRRCRPRVLRLDPVADRDEYASLLDMLGESAASGGAASLESLAGERPARRPRARAAAARRSG